MNKKTLITIVVSAILAASAFFAASYFIQPQQKEPILSEQSEAENEIAASENESTKSQNETTDDGNETTGNSAGADNKETGGLAESKTSENSTGSAGNDSQDEEAADNFVQCLAKAGMVIYGSKTCPACAALVEGFGGYDEISPIYVECSEEGDRCSQEMKTYYVPEIQIKGEIYTGPRDLDSLAAATGCKLR